MKEFLKLKLSKFKVIDEGRINEYIEFCIIKIHLKKN